MQAGVDLDAESSHLDKLPWPHEENRRKLRRVEAETSIILIPHLSSIVF